MREATARSEWNPASACALAPAATWSACRKEGEDAS
jgi:hypothetical protein